MEPIDGTWHIETNEAVEKDGQGRILFAKPHPVPATSMVAYLDAVDPQEDDVYELLVNANEDGTNMHVAKFIIGSDQINIQLYRNNTLLEQEETVGWTGQPFRMQAIISRTQFCASISNAVFSQVWYPMPDLFANGYYAGMGTAEREDIQVDDWEFYEHLETFQGCPFCICHCEDYPMSPKLIATIVDTDGRMVDFEDCEIQLEWDRTLLNWEQDPAQTCNCKGEPYLLGLKLFCDGVEFKLQNIGLQISDTCHDSVLGNSHIYNPLIPPSTCDPFFLRFGPIQIAAGDLACCFDTFDDPGEYYIEITEPP
jgi:hypothetical protein